MTSFQHTNFLTFFGKDPSLERDIENSVVGRTVYRSLEKSSHINPVLKYVNSRKAEECADIDLG